MNILFAGTPEFAAVALDALLRAGHQVSLVLTQPDRPAGRGLKPQPSAVKQRALAHGLAVAQPATLKDETVVAQLTAVAADVMVVAAYGLILPPPVLRLPRFGCLNIHASLLPRWRGAAPIQRAILAGDHETGITIMQMDEGLDTGAILCTESLSIGPATTCAELHDRLAVLGGRMVAYALNGLEAGVLAATPQAEEGATYAAKLSREEGRLDWRETARALERRVRAFSPWPGAWFEHDGTRIKVIEAQVMGGAIGPRPGDVLDDRLTVACGDGALRLTRVQREGRQVQAAAEFLRGYALAKGTHLALPDSAAEA